MAKSYYEILGVAEDADQRSILRAYRGAMREIHPDLYPDSQRAARRARQLNAARETLLDSEKRSRYDALLTRQRQSAAAGETGQPSPDGPGTSDSVPNSPPFHAHPASSRTTNSGRSTWQQRSAGNAAWKQPQRGTGYVAYWLGGFMGLAGIAAALFLLWNVDWERLSRGDSRRSEAEPSRTTSGPSPSLPNVSSSINDGVLRRNDRSSSPAAAPIVPGAPPLESLPPTELPSSTVLQRSQPPAGAAGGPPLVADGTGDRDTAPRGPAEDGNAASAPAGTAPSRAERGPSVPVFEWLRAVPEAAERAAIPSDAALAEAVDSADERFFQTQIDDLLDLARTDRFDDWSKLAGQRLDWLSEDDEPAERFLGLARAIEYAIESGDLAMTDRCIRSMCREFAVDETDIQRFAVKKWAEMVKENYWGDFRKAREKELGRLTLQVAERAENEMRLGDSKELYELALTLFPEASGLHSATREKLDATRVKMKRVERIAQLERQGAAPLSSSERLELGQYWCLERDDWERGLAHLAEGSDALLSAAATTELVKGSEPEDVGNAWYEVFSNETGEFQFAAALRARRQYRLLRQGPGTAWTDEIAGRMEKLDAFLLPKMERAIVPFDGAKARSLQEQWADFLGVPARISGPAGMEFVLIPPGEFLMGADDAMDASPRHRVKLTRAFYLGTTEVTQAQYVALMGKNPSSFGGRNAEREKRPVETVTWQNAAEFCRRLGDRQDAVVRLPTEAEWEFVLRGGSQGRFWFGGADGDLLNAYVWCASNSGNRVFDADLIFGNSRLNPERLRELIGLRGCRPQPVGQKPANPFGVYDMEGNLSEWCADWYGKNYYRRSPEEDPRGPDEGKVRLIRGCNYLNLPSQFVPWQRWALAPHPAFGPRYDFVGFRVVIEIDP